MTRRDLFAAMAAALAGRKIAIPAAAPAPLNQFDDYFAEVMLPAIDEGPTLAQEWDPVYQVLRVKMEQRFRSPCGFASVAAFGFSISRRQLCDEPNLYGRLRRELTRAIDNCVRSPYCPGPHKLAKTTL